MITLIGAPESGVELVRQCLGLADTPLIITPHALDAVDANASTASVLVHRDARLVAKLSQTAQRSGTALHYRECAEVRVPSRPADLIRFQSNQERLVAQDKLRPRPEQGSLHAARWRHLSQADMVAYGWNRFNAAALDWQAKSGKPSYAIGADGLTAETLARLAEDLGLPQPDFNAIETAIQQVRAVTDKALTAPGDPMWFDWTSAQRESFSMLAGGMMQVLGYWTDPNAYWRPDNFGKHWLHHEDIAAWYGWMYDSRRRQHETFEHWYLSVDPERQARTILDLGCGTGEGYCDFFADHAYTGYDISIDAIDWAKANRTNSKHDYGCYDYLATPPGGTYDLVFSSGCIDNSFDTDLYLKRMVEMSNGWIYATCYSGWYPDIVDHEYSYVPKEGYFNTRISASRVRQTLEQLGCTDIDVRPILSSGESQPLETQIVARVAGQGIP